jgi:hypothetical protein
MPLTNGLGSGAGVDIMQTTSPVCTSIITALPAS